MSMILLEQHAEINIQPIEPDLYLISFHECSWYLWPDKNRWVLKEKLNDTDQYFYGDIVSFYKKNIKELKSIPKNKGKTWSEQEDKILMTLINELNSLVYIAKQLERSVISILYRVGQIEVIDIDAALVPRSMWNKPALDVLNFLS